MKAIIKEVGKSARVEDIKNELSTLQELVGGYIETVTLNDVVMICNEEGKTQGLKPNFAMGFDVVVGTAVFVAHDGRDEFTDLNDCHIEDIMSKLS